MPAVAFKKDKIAVPNPPSEINAVEGHFERAQAQERCWPEHSIKLIEKDNLDEEDIIAWSAYHASLQHPSDDIQPALTQLLPLFYEKAASASMIKHGMDVVRRAIQFLNPGQIPACNCVGCMHHSSMCNGSGLKHMVKQSMLSSPYRNGDMEHIWRLFGIIRLDYCTDPGRYCIFWHSGLFPQSSSPHHAGRDMPTKWAPSLWVSCRRMLFIRLRDCTMRAPKRSGDKQWLPRVRHSSIGILYSGWKFLVWSLYDPTESKTSPSMNVESLKGLAPCFFALDHQNYARWIPIHIRDMESLHISIHHDCGHWVIQKTTNRFSATYANWSSSWAK